MAAARAELSRLGWGWPSAFVFVDREGTEIPLRKVSPKRLEALFRRDRQAQLGEQLARKQGLDRPVDSAHVRAFLAKASVEPRAKAIARMLFTDSVPTLAGMKARGYDTDGVCMRCGLGQDTIAHRLWHCQ